MRTPPVDVCYKVNAPLSSQQFIELLAKTSLGPRRPLDDEAAIAGMLKHANLLVSAWQGEALVGIARSVTDFNFCCYLSDLAVSEDCQHAGIGKKLIQQTAQQLEKGCKIILLAAPLAVDYYPKLGFEKHNSAWIMPASDLHAEA
ncbi:GNAT family N-acetyltransferase [Pectobacterium odoriferum]|uniref:GNAT family N-acetyltransferase n=1 Tax=Pectobacterium odoriferum TaxID=78398 RepID=UPI0005006FA8|nr:GNAT family N-acetyltransferase [Pectobacterium odoriferum]KGA32407.1 acetyltransferase [Pectobacterium odoriferum]MBA0189325.1 GNAT family N-acetyltransferase [Pectobacterium odoriferum]POE00231.1 N-acetyltransferase [Pectobacterium odoriferum]POE01760.1 N-acetyltransferase [Pectobacterium odoriferum]POE22297.1 N-acetyltransferase [Pectobacterium odoriferum]